MGASATASRAASSHAPVPVAATALRVLQAPFSWRTWAELLYVVASLPLAVLGLGYVVASLALGLGLAVTLVGLPVLALGGLGALRLTVANRWLAQTLVDERVTAPRRLVATPGFFGWLQAALRDGAAWRARVYLLVKLPLAVVTAYVTVALWVEGLFCASYPIWWHLSGPGRVPGNVPLDLNALVFRGGLEPRLHLSHKLTLYVGRSYADTWPSALLVSLAGIVTLLAAPWVARALVWVDRLLIRQLLGGTRGATRLRELEVARAQVVDDSAVTLRRIERDLHDGTQAQLATLAMTLGQAKEKLEHRAGVPYDPAGALGLVDTAHGHAKEALVELRGIARGIHPPALDLGLEAALGTLVARSAVPAVLRADVRARPSQAIETIAYFSAAELLANVARHSRARHATVDVSVDGELLRLRVSDDGVGGAGSGSGSGAGAGSGLVGLADRVGAVDGRLRVSSPPGGPTVVTVELPLGA